MFEDLTPNEEQRAFADAAARCFSKCSGASFGEIAKRVAADGFLAMLAPQETGGLGLSLRSVLPVARAAGQHLLGFPLIEAILAARYLPLGDRVATIAWGGDAVVQDEAANGTVSRAPGATTARWLAFGAGADIALVDLQASGIEIAPPHGLDLDRPYADITLCGARVIAVAKGRWAELTYAGALLRAADMLGAAETSFADARTHVSARRQFGRPLSALQTVSSALARDHFTLTTAALSIAYAALTSDEATADAAIARDVACSVTADACCAAAENAIQLHGALGFTAALPLHRRLRRIQEATDIYNAKTARANLAAHLLDSWKEAA